ncbi:MAG: hypothetical protein NXI24_05710 [bacterium]|nr:hypothetical protein [bacterium]
MEILNEAGVLVIQEAAISSWIWLLLLLPAIFIVGAIHFLRSSAQAETINEESPDPRGRGFALGVILLAGVFLPLPWVASETYSGLRFEFDEAAKLVSVRDGRSPGIYATPFAGFRGLILTSETKSKNDDSGGTETTYELMLARVTGPVYALLRTKDRERVLELANRLSHMLRVTTVTDFHSALAFAREAPNTAARMPNRFECDGSSEGSAPDSSAANANSNDSPGAGLDSHFRSLQKRYLVDGDATSCVLEYPKQVPALILPGSLLALTALYWCVYIARHRGFDWRVGIGFALSIIFLIAMGSVFVRNFDATGVVSFQAPGNGEEARLQTWSESAWFGGRFAESGLPLREIRVVQALISTQADSFFLYDRNPLAFRGLADAFDTARNLKTVELELSALPAVERLRLADILATGLAW